MKPPRGLAPDEAALWRKVAATVTPLKPRLLVEVAVRRPGQTGSPPPASPPLRPASVLRHPAAGPPPAKAEDRPVRRALPLQTLDATWDRRLARGLVVPDAQIDLHGLGLDTAYDRLMRRLAQAGLTGARVVLVIAGKPRPHGDHGHGDHAQRASRRGAIRAKLIDWLAASPHAARIAAIRPAHPRHGGAGAVYVVFRRAGSGLSETRVSDQTLSAACAIRR